MKSLAATCWRDPWGIPHVRARGESEAFEALGFVHAQDRLWQMEALLRRGIGRYAQWMGEAALRGDILARQLDTAGASRRDFAALSARPQQMLEAYARGVNRFIRQSPVPYEYSLQQTEPLVWEPWFSIAVMRQIGFLMGSVWWKLWRAAAMRFVGPEGATRLVHEDSGADLLCVPPGLTPDQWRANLADLAPGIIALLEIANADTTGGGSNNWALAGAHTASGRALLAGDPHRALEIPNLYCQTHLACDHFDVIGLTVPGVPGFPHFAHNGKVAWSVTHAFVDIHDLYIERFDRGAQASQSGEHWEPVHRRTEKIAVHRKADVEIEVIRTRHGPVVAGDPYKGIALVLSSMQFEPLDRSFECLLPMLEAGSVSQLYEATRGWGLIDHNLVAADTAGHIGNRVRALVPRRPASNGWLPVPGWTGQHEWAGVIPFEDMPACIDPPGGRVVTANNRVAAATDDYLTLDAMPPHRARRIWQRLQRLSKATVDDMADIHRDDLSQPALELRDFVAALEFKDPAAKRLQAQLAAWDGHMAVDSLAAAAYIAIRIELTRRAAECSGLSGVRGNLFTQVSPGIRAENQLWWSIPGLLRDDDTTLLRGQTWRALVTAAVQQVAAGRQSPWGEVHRPQLIHPLLMVMPERKAELAHLSADVPGDNDTVCATGCIPSMGPRTLYASLARYVFDVGAWQNSRWIVFHGVSGNPTDPWFMNQNTLWSRGEMIPMLYDWHEIERQAVGRQDVLEGSP